MTHRTRSRQMLPMDPMSASCPGFLDRYGIWNNGFDCSLPRICCGTDINRYCCIPSSTSPLSVSPSAISTSHSSFDHFSSYSIRTSDNSSLSEKWIFIQMCTVGILLAIMLLIFVLIYLCLTSIKHPKHHKNTSIVQIPLAAPSHYIKPSSNRISTISSVSSDGKSRCTDTSIVFNTPLNLYPTSHSRDSTASSYYIYPNELEYLCK